MLVKSLKGANEDSAILQDTSHSIVNVLQHLAALSHSLKGVRKVVTHQLVSPPCLPYSYINPNLVSLTHLPSHVFSKNPFSLKMLDQI